MSLGLRRAMLLLTTASIPISAANAGDLLWNDFVAPYLQRLDAVTPDAGNASAANTAIQMIDPWPRHAGRRHIPGDGKRMAEAVERYRDVSKLPLAPQPISPVAISSSGLSNSTGSTTSAATTSSK